MRNLQFLFAEELHQAAGMFHTNSRQLRRKLWWKNMKVRAIGPCLTQQCTQSPRVTLLCPCDLLNPIITNCFVEQMKLIIGGIVLIIIGVIIAIAVTVSQSK